MIDGELRQGSRSKLPLALIMFNLDHFKQINDRFGHLCGDAVLASVGNRMNAVLRSSDLKYRDGGEELISDSATRDDAHGRGACGGAA